LPASLKKGLYHFKDLGQIAVFAFTVTPKPLEGFAAKQKKLQAALAV
jgi:hypothetical protein